MDSFSIQLISISFHYFLQNVLNNSVILSLIIYLYFYKKICAHLFFMHFKFSNDLNENLKFNEATFGKYSNDTKYYKSK